MWGWYLQNDIQLFIISMLLLFIYRKHKKLSKVLISLIVVGSCVFTFSYTYRNDIPNVYHFSDAVAMKDYQKDVYIKPWARCPPYLLGLLLGMFYSEYQKEQ